MKPVEKTLLWIDDIVPIDSLGAGYPRAREIINMTAAMGWNVIVYPLLISGLSLDEVRKSLPSRVKFIKEGLGEKWLLIFLENYIDQLDVIAVSRPHNRATLNRILKQAPHILSKCRFVYDCEAIYSERDLLAKKLQGKKVDEDEELNAIKSEILAASEGMHAISCVSIKDAHVFKVYSPDNKDIYELNLPLTVVQNTPDFADRHGLLFIGRLLEQDSPNSQGLMWFLNSVWPLIRARKPHIALTIIGYYHADMRTLYIDGVNWIGSVDNLQPYYDRARVFIAPISLASGIPLKILNAAAGGIPVVGTERMRELLQWPTTALPSQNTDIGFAKEVLDLHENHAKWSLTKNTCQALIKDHYSVEKFKANLNGLLGCN